MPYSFASSTGSRHGTLDGFDTTSVLSIEPEGESTRNDWGKDTKDIDIRIRESAKAYKYWGGNKKSPINVNSSYIANAFQDFSQGVPTSGSEHSVETGRGARSASQQQGPIQVDRKPSPAASIHSAKQHRSSRFGSSSTPPATPSFAAEQITPTNSGKRASELRNASVASNLPQSISNATRKTTPSFVPFFGKSNGNARARSSSNGLENSFVSTGSRLSPRPASMSSPKHTTYDSRFGFVERPISPSQERVVPAHLRHTLEPGYIPPHLKGRQNTTPPPDRLDNYVSGASQTGNGEYRDTIDCHARVDDTEASFLSDRPATVTFTSKSRFQGANIVDNTLDRNKDIFKAVSTDPAPSKMAFQATSADDDAHRLNIKPPTTALSDFSEARNPNTYSNTVIDKILPAHGPLASSAAAKASVSDPFAAFKRPQPDTANTTQFSFAIPEMADISKVLGGTYKKPTTNASNAYNPFNIPTPPEEHGYIQGLPVSIEEKDLYLAIQALQTQVMQLKGEKAQQEQATGLARTEIETLKLSVSVTETRNLKLEQEIAVLRAERAQMDAHHAQNEETRRKAIRDLEQTASAAELRATQFEDEVRRVNEEMVKVRKVETTTNSQIKDLQAEIYRAYAHATQVEEENKVLREKKDEADSAFGGDDEVNALKAELETTRKQVHQAVENMGILEKECMRLQQNINDKPVPTVEHEGNNPKDEEQYEDEATIRPSQPPGVALRAVIERIEIEITAEKEDLEEATRAYNQHHAGYGMRHRKLLKEKMDVIVNSIEARSQDLYDLHDVLESGL